MSDIPPPEQPGWYADAHGAWWWWDGSRWSPAPDTGSGSVTSARSQERSQAVLMWVLYLVIGGWIAALVFHLTSKEKPFTRHHAAEALNLTLVLLVPQILSLVLLVPAYIDWIRTLDDLDAGVGLGPSFFAGLALAGLTSIVNVALGIAGAVKAGRGQWWRLPIGLHPVRGVLPSGARPPYDVNEA